MRSTTIPVLNQHPKTSVKNYLSHEALRQEASFRFAIPVACPSRVSVTGVGEGRSVTEGVVSTFFLIRYQTAIASSRETNFARQFSSVSWVHRMETNTERQFFEVCPSIFPSKLICDACRLIAMNPTIVLTTLQNRQRGCLSVKLQSRWLVWFLIAAELIS